MCGRYAFFSAHEAIARLFGVVGAGAIEPRFNIAPTQFVPVVRTDHAGIRRLATLYWGLVPFWAKQRGIGARMINARAETLAEKPAFRAAYRKRRCLVLADGYYEWRASSDGKQPYFVRLTNREPFAMAGLWESWIECEGSEPLESCAIVTSAATPTIASLHDRMPLILPSHAYAAWLDRATSPADLDRMLRAAPEASLTYAPVSKRVNTTYNDDADLIEPLEASIQTRADAVFTQRDLFD